MVSVKHQTGKQRADSHGKQTHPVAVSRNIISIKQQVSQNQSGLIKHKRIMTPENDKKRKCRHIQKQRRAVVLPAVPNVEKPPYPQKITPTAE